VAWPRNLAAATVAALVRARWWLLALAAFLVRGGILLILPPLVLLPTPAELANLLSPSLLGTGLGAPTALLVSVVAIAGLGLLLVVVLTTVLGTWLDLALVEAEEADPELARIGPSHPRASLIAAIEARLVAHIPTAVVAVLAAMALGAAATAEFIGPQGTGPIYLRILSRASIAPAATVVAWLLGEAWGGLAMRRLGTGTSVLQALRLGLADLLHPSGLVTLVLSTAVVALPLAALWLATGRAFTRLWSVLGDPSDGGLIIVALALLVGTWAAGLWLLAIGLTWRSAAWTAEALRRD
jgi:hypothetical protein